MSNEKRKLAVNIEGLSTPLSPEEVLAITKDWDSTNKRRRELIDKEIGGHAGRRGTVSPADAGGCEAPTGNAAAYKGPGRN